MRVLLALVMMVVLASAARADTIGWVLLYDRNGLESARVPPASVNRATGDLRIVVYGPRGSWVALLGKNGYAFHGLPPTAVHELKSLRAGGHVLTDVALAPNPAGWVMLSDQNGFWDSQIPTRLSTRLLSLHYQHATIKHVAFTGQGGWVVLYNTNGYSTANIPPKALAMLKSLNAAHEEIKDVEFGPNQCWLVLYGQNGWAGSGLPVALENKLRSLHAAGSTFIRAGLTY